MKTISWLEGGAQEVGGWGRTVLGQARGQEPLLRVVLLLWVTWVQRVPASGEKV